MAGLMTGTRISSLPAMNGEVDLLLDWIWSFDDDVHPAVKIGEFRCIRA
jgi:hypothetical protein